MTIFKRVHGVGGRAGFTLVELLIGMLLSVIVLAAVFQTVFAQNHAYGRQQGMADARQSLRAAGTLLGWELRHLSADGGDLYAIGADSVSLRSFDGFGVICRKRVSHLQYGLHSISGDISAGDSVLLYGVNSNRPVDDTWRTAELHMVDSPSLLGMGTTCPLWPGNPPIETAVHLNITSNADTAGIRVGAPVRTFHRRTYRMVQQDGEWWLGVREGDGGYQLLTGPLNAGNGLGFRFMDAAGNTTTVPGDVQAVEFVLRAKAQLRRTSEEVPRDSVVMRVQLRG